MAIWKALWKPICARLPSAVSKEIFVIIHSPPPSNSPQNGGRINSSPILGEVRWGAERLRDICNFPTDLPPQAGEVRGGLLQIFSVTTQARLCEAVLSPKQSPVWCRRLPRRKSMLLAETFQREVEQLLFSLIMHQHCKIN